MAVALDAARAVGRSVARADAAPKLRGRAAFAGDLEFPGLLHARVVRSPLAHARIRGIDTRAAERLPGVACVLTGARLDLADPYWGHRIRDRPLLAIDRVRFAGEPVAAVAACDEATAQAAAEAIRVDYEELAPIVGLDGALRPDAALVHDGPLRPGSLADPRDSVAVEGNVCYRFRAQQGDLDGAFAAAAFRVEHEYRFPAVYQYAMETHTVVARADAGEITVWASCQHPFLVRAELATLFELPLASVRVIVPYVGGGFGSKSYTKMEPIAVALARATGRPVRVRNSVDESMVTTRRHNMRARMRTAMAVDGRLLARDLRCWLDTGAYADNGPRVAAVVGEVGIGPYRWEAYRSDSSCVYTHTAPAGSYRAFGAVHAQWIGESQIDELARLAGLDPLAVRLRNVSGPGDQVRAGGGKPLDADLAGDLERLAAAVDWDGERPPLVGRGLSVGLIPAGAQAASSATARLEADGRVTVLVGTSEIGQGARTVMAQIAAEVLGLPLGRVGVQPTDTRATPYDRSTGASRSTTVAGLAVQRAAEDLRAQLRDLAGGEDPDPATFGALVERRFGLFGGELVGRGEVDPDSFAGEMPLFWEVCAAAVEVDLDPDVGTVRVRRLATVADVGRAINPQLVERQDEGAALQGIGNALFEQLRYDDRGRLLDDTLLTYRVPTFADLPDEMTCVLVENGDGPGPFGAKGCGEGALAAIPGAVVNALADAGVTGLRELPLTPERVWRRLQELRTA